MGGLFSSRTFGRRALSQLLPVLGSRPPLDPLHPARRRRSYLGSLGFGVRPRSRRSRHRRDDRCVPPQERSHPGPGPVRQVHRDRGDPLHRRVCRERRTGGSDRRRVRILAGRRLEDKAADPKSSPARRNRRRLGSHLSGSLGRGHDLDRSPLQGRLRVRSDDSLDHRLRDWLRDLHRPLRLSTHLLDSGRDAFHEPGGADLLRWTRRGLCARGHPLRAGLLRNARPDLPPNSLPEGPDSRPRGPGLGNSWALLSRGLRRRLRAHRTRASKRARIALHASARFSQNPRHLSHHRVGTTTFPRSSPSPKRSSSSGWPHSSRAWPTLRSALSSWFAR